MKINVCFMFHIVCSNKWNYYLCVRYSSKIISFSIYVIELYYYIGIFSSCAEICIILTIRSNLFYIDEWDMIQVIQIYMLNYVKQHIQHIYTLLSQLILHLTNTAITPNGLENWIYMNLINLNIFLETMVTQKFVPTTSNLTVLQIF